MVYCHQNNDTDTGYQVYSGQQYEIFIGNALPKLRIWWTVTAMVITMMILLLHVRFRITTGSAFSSMMTTIQILMDFKPIP